MILIVQITFPMMGNRNARDAFFNSHAMTIRFRARRSAEGHIGRAFSLGNSLSRSPTPAAGINYNVEAIDALNNWNRVWRNRVW
ncbi:hypothetical protein [Novipirellula sp.]|uniref:hypothetical protein n=1 Tax=Novipirellula sp. TaxID=2795430 RepID=UPI00356AD22D